MKLNAEYLRNFLTLLNNEQFLNEEESDLAPNLVKDDFSFAKQLSMTAACTIISTYPVLKSGGMNYL